MSVANVSLNNSNNSILNTATSGNGNSNLENQLAVKQQRLNRISSDANLNEDEKAKEQLRLQQQIAELNREIKLEELKLQEQKKKTISDSDNKVVQEKRNEDMLNKTHGNAETSDGVESSSDYDMSQTAINISDMLSKDFFLRQEVVRRNTDRHNELVGNIIKTEIKTDELKGMDVARKKAYFEDIKSQYDVFGAIRTKDTVQNTSKEVNGSKIIIRE